MSPSRTWEVLLIGGASGVGKTSVSYRLARHFETGITEVDDFQVLLETMTTPEQQPVLHFWHTHPDPFNLPSERIVEQAIAIGQVMQPGLSAIIANHLESQQPIVLEGDFILPALAVQPAFGEIANTGQVRAVFIDEPDEVQIAHNYHLREPEAGDQSGRARISWLYGRWLKQEAERLGGIVMPSRPWDTLFERIIEALSS